MSAKRKAEKAAAAEKLAEQKAASAAVAKAAEEKAAKDAKKQAAAEKLAKEQAASTKAAGEKATKAAASAAVAKTAEEKAAKAATKQAAAEKLAKEQAASAKAAEEKAAKAATKAAKEEAAAVAKRAKEQPTWTQHMRKNCYSRKGATSITGSLGSMVGFSSNCVGSHKFMCAECRSLQEALRGQVWVQLHPNVERSVLSAEALCDP